MGCPLYLEIYNQRALSYVQVDKHDTCLTKLYHLHQRKILAKISDLTVDEPWHDKSNTLNLCRAKT